MRGAGSPGDPRGHDGADGERTGGSAADPNLEAGPPDNLTGTVMRGAGLAGLGYFMAQALRLAAYLTLARLATPTDFGEFAAASIVVNVGLLFTESGMLAALIQRRDRIDEAASTAVASTALGGILFSLAALGASPLIGLGFGSARIGELAAVMAGLLLVRSLQVVPEALLQRRFSFLRRMVVEPAQVVAFGVVAIVATSNGLGPWGLVLGFYAAAVTDVVLSWALVRWRPRARLISFAMWRELIGYARHLISSNIVLRVREEVPTVLVGVFIGSAPLGQYRYADRLWTTPFSLLLAAAAYVVFPALSRITDERERFAAALLRSLGSVAALACLFGLLLVPFGLPAALIVLGDTWRDVGHLAIPMGAGVTIAAITALLTEALKAYGRPDVLLPAHSIAGLVAVVAMAAMLPFGVVGVASGMVVGFAAGNLYESRRLAGILDLRIRDLYSRVWAPLTAAALMAAGMLPLDRLVVEPASHGTAAGLALLAGEVVLAITIFAGLLLLLAPHTVGEAREGLIAAKRRRSDAMEQESAQPG